jgi:hypothetical protein
LKSVNPPHGSQRAISVGGSSGIHIDGGSVQIGGVPFVERQPVQPPTPIAVVDLTRATALLVRHSGLVTAALSTGAGVLVVGAAALISLLQLPWLLLAAPGAAGAILLTAALALLLYARKRITTGGIEPEVERRILEVAVACKGRVTVTAVARALAMPMAEADATLAAFARSGHVTVDNDPASGVVVYVFPDIEAGLVPMRRSP